MPKIVPYLWALVTFYRVSLGLSVALAAVPEARSVAYSDTLITSKFVSAAF